MLRKKIGSFKVPLLNRGIRQISSYLEEVVKPQRSLGAPFVSDLSATQKCVNMCEFCWRKYYGWWRKEDYRPDWDCRMYAACDGCSTRDIPCVVFYPEQNFYKVLTESHGRMPEPNRRIYKT